MATRVRRRHGGVDRLSDLPEGERVSDLHGVLNFEKSYPSINGTASPALRRFGGREGNWIRRSCEDFAINIFVGNLSGSMTNNWLRSIFIQFGEIRSVFLSPRINSKGKKFGFIKFRTHGDGIEAIKRLDGLWVRDGKMIVNVARYDKKRIDHVKPHFAQPRLRIDSCRADFSTRASPEKSFREAVNKGGTSMSKMMDKKVTKQVEVRVANENCDLGARNGDIETTEISGGRVLYNSGRICKIAFVPSIREIDWLNRSVVCKLRFSNDSIPLFQSMEKHKFHGADYAFLGGSYLLLSFPSLDEKVKILESNQDWLKENFSEVAEWTSKFRCDDKFVRVRIDGIPLHGWNPELFKEIGNLWGQFFSAEPSACEKTRVDSVRVTILMKQSIEIPDSITIDIGGELFKLNLYIDSNFIHELYASDHDKPDSLLDQENDLDPDSPHVQEDDSHSNYENVVNMSSESDVNVVEVSASNLDKSECVPSYGLSPNSPPFSNPTPNLQLSPLPEFVAETQLSNQSNQIMNDNIVSTADNSASKLEKVRGSGSKYLEFSGELRKGYFLRKPKIKSLVLPELVKKDSKSKDKDKKVILPDKTPSVVFDAVCPLKEAEKTWELGKLLGFEALAPEAGIIQSLI